MSFATKRMTLVMHDIASIAGQNDECYALFASEYEVYIQRVFQTEWHVREVMAVWMVVVPHVIQDLKP